MHTHTNKLVIVSFWVSIILKLVIAVSLEFVSTVGCCEPKSCLLALRRFMQRSFVFNSLFNFSLYFVSLFGPVTDIMQLLQVGICWVVS